MKGSPRTLVLPLYPHAEQAKKLNLILGAVRCTYNDLIEYCNDIIRYNREVWRVRMDCDYPWEIEGLSPKQDYLQPPSEYELIAKASELREINLWRRDAYGTCVNEAGSRASDAITGYFRRLMKGEHPGLLRTKSAGHFKTFTYTASNQYHFDPEWLSGEKGPRIHLGGVGLVRFGNENAARCLPSMGELKQAKVKRSRYQNEDQWELIIYYDTVEPKQYRELNLDSQSKEPVGIDIGARKTAVLSDGTVVENPRLHEKRQDERADLQRKLSETDPKSPEWRKLIGRLRHLEDHIRNSVNDTMHKTTRKIALEHDVIVMEDLKVTDINNLNDSKKTHREFSDACPGKFRRMLGYKADEAGSEIVLVDPAYTSQTCSRCGKRTDPGSSETFVCRHCGYTLDRDLNASRNILGRGIRLVIRGTPSMPESQRDSVPNARKPMASSG